MENTKKTLEIDFRTKHDVINYLYSNSEKASSIIEEVWERNYNFRLDVENYDLFVIIDDIDEEDDSDFEEMKDLEEELNELFETVHYGVDYCNECNEYTRIEYTPAQFIFYMGTIQLCDCGARCSRSFTDKEKMLEKCNNSKEIYTNI